MKTFQGDLLKIYNLLINKEPFAFNRFSDGELFILQNKELILDNNLIKIDDKIMSGPYKKEDFKHFDPSKHSFTRDQLIEAFRFSKKNYFKGISCSCCCSEKDFDWQLDFMQDGKDEYLTWSNLFVNGNYNTFLNSILPQFYANKIVFICNENANLKKFPFVIKDFRVGYNAMVNDYPLIENIKKWIIQNKIENYIFLFSASTFSKLAIYQLFKNFDKNTYIDIGTTLNPMMDMRLDRAYLRSYWYGTKEADINKICIWKNI